MENTIKAVLDRVFIISKRINLIEAEILSLQKDKSKYPDKFKSEKEKNDLEEILKLSLDSILRYKMSIYNLICTIPESEIRIVMEYRYILMLKFDDIAERLFYSRRHTLRLHAQGIEFLSKNLKGIL